MSARDLATLRPVFRTADIRAIEARAVAQASHPPLMERAGLAAAELARTLLGAGHRVLVVAGPGNNGGDAFVVARNLKSWWFDVTVLFAGREDRLAGEAAEALSAWRAAGGITRAHWPETPRPDLVIDGLFGIGLDREVTGIEAELVARMNTNGVPVLALDVPSGLHADSGRVLGVAVRATHTGTFIALKPGLLTLDGPDHAGQVHVCDLGIDIAAPGPSHGRRLDDAVIRAALQARSANSHKGSYGNVGIIGGAEGMVGAALLAARAAAKLGAGRTFVGCLGLEAPAVDAVQPELMLRPAADVVALEGLSALAVGPGLGQSDRARVLLASAIERNVPLLLDADALNLVASDGTAAAALAARADAAVLTPHPAEAARLLGGTTAEIQRDRVESARRLAERFGAWVVLKGAGSVCATPDGHWFVNASGNPGLASAGMGDVLAGLIAALMGQGSHPLLALLAGVHLHGRAADRLLGTIGGPVGITASEVIDAARAVLNETIYASG
jgi:hydroxyethylthiazole kinase-like uncharacterized protein yjeF